jgi:hypothetical protein
MILLKNLFHRSEDILIGGDMIHHAIGNRLGYFNLFTSQWS